MGEDYEALKREHNNFGHETDRLILEENLTLLAMYGLKDTIRDDVQKTIEVLASAETRTRIVSGDHEMTVKSLAKSLEIVDCEDDEEAIISGKEFEKKCEKYMTGIKKKMVHGISISTTRPKTANLSKNFLKEILKNSMASTDAIPSINKCSSPR